MEIDALLQSVLAAVAGGGGAYAAVRVELRWLRADINRHETEIKQLREVRVNG